MSRENLHEEGRVRAAHQSRFGAQVRSPTRWRGQRRRRGHQRQLSERTPRIGRADRCRHRPNGTATSSFRITWMIDRTRTDEAVRLLHRTFIETACP
jgi:aspartate kinase